jgi:hypothetical protein
MIYLELFRVNPWVRMPVGRAILVAHSERVRALPFERQHLRDDRAGCARADCATVHTNKNHRV